MRLGPNINSAICDATSTEWQLTSTKWCNSKTACNLIVAHSLKKLRQSFLQGPIKVPGNIIRVFKQVSIEQIFTIQENNTSKCSHYETKCGNGTLLTEHSHTHTLLQKNTYLIDELPDI